MLGAIFGTLIEGESNAKNVGTALLLVAGVGLTGFGGYMHLTVAARVRAGQCDGCAPWHPLFVLAPLGIGVGLLLIAGFLHSRR